VCGLERCDVAWLQHHHGHSFRCADCGAYSLNDDLWNLLAGARTRGDQRVLKLLPGLKRAIRAATELRQPGQPLPHYTLETWEAEALDHVVEARSWLTVAANDVENVIGDFESDYSEQGDPPMSAVFVANQANPDGTIDLFFSPATRPWLLERSRRWFPDLNQTPCPAPAASDVSFRAGDRRAARALRDSEGGLR
jgi:hypothetical protein